MHKQTVPIAGPWPQSNVY